MQTTKCSMKNVMSCRAEYRIKVHWKFKLLPDGEHSVAMKMLISYYLPKAYLLGEQNALDIHVTGSLIVFVLSENYNFSLAKRGY